MRAGTTKTPYLQVADTEAPVGYHAQMALRVALLDMDGTIWNAPIAWNDIRTVLGLPDDSTPIIEHLSELPDRERRRGLTLLEDYEARGARDGHPLPGADTLLASLRDMGLKTVLVTNNSRASAEAVLSRYPLPFDLVLSRDEGPMKPSADAFLGPLRSLDHSPEEAVAIGDTHLDALAAHAAGIAHTILVSPSPWALRALPVGLPCVMVPHLDDARRIIVDLVHQMAQETPHPERGTTGLGLQR